MAYFVWPQLNDLYYREGAEQLVYTGVGSLEASGDIQPEVTIPISGAIIVADFEWKRTSSLTMGGSFSLSGNVNNTGIATFTGVGGFSLEGSVDPEGEVTFTGSGTITFSGTAAIYYPFHYGFWPSYGWWNIGWWWSPTLAHERKLA